MEVRARENEDVTIVRIPQWKDAEKEITEKLRNVIESETYVDKKEGGEYGYEVYIDKRYEVFGDDTLRKISKDGIEAGTNQFDYLNENYVFDWEIAEKESRVGEIIESFKKKYPQEYEDYQDEIEEWLNEYVYAYVNPEDLNQEIDVSITLDIGDGNYDFSCNNLFNEWDDYSYELNPLSPVVWLARQQKKLSELKKAIKDIKNNTYVPSNYSKFTQSCIQEFNNQFHCMSCMTFLVRMGLNDYIKLQGMIRRQEESNKENQAEYDYNKRKDSGEYIVIDKKVECGLFNPWLGGGSMLEIDCEKDIKIPTKAIWKAWIEVHGGCDSGYTVDEVYGLCRSVFDTPVEIHGKECWE